MELEIDQTSRARWEALTDAALAPMQQRWAYGAAVAAMGGCVVRVELLDGGGAALGTNRDAADWS